VADIIQIRRDTSANWTSENPTLADGEMGFDVTEAKFKVGDGATAWSSLGYNDGVWIDDGAGNISYSAGAVSGLWSNNGTVNGSAKFVSLTQAEYDETTPDSDTIYFIE
jgi:hypothetical protein